MRNSTKGFTLIELLVVIAIIAVLAAILFPVFARAREKARQSTCISNQRQIAAAITMFAQDHEETFPNTATLWSDINADPGILMCPTAGKTIANGYIGNPSYSLTAFPAGYVVWGSAIGTIPDPSSLWMTADGANRYVDPRHSKKAVASFVDGHVAATDNLPVERRCVGALMGLYYTNGSFTGTGVKRTDARIAFDTIKGGLNVDGFNLAGMGLPLSGPYSIRWTGYIKAPVTGTYTFTANAVDPDAGNTITQYQWDFGDGTAIQTSATATISHTYASTFAGAAAV